MARTYIRKTERGSWTKDSMNKAMAAVKSGLSKLAAAKKFNVPEPTLRRYLKKAESGQVMLPTSIGRYKDTFSVEESRLLKKFIEELDRRAFGLTAIQVRKLAFTFAVKNNIPNRFNPDSQMAGKDWLSNFMKTNRLSLRTPENTSIGRLMGFNKVNVSKFFEVWRELKTAMNFSSNNIYNCDETCLSTVPNKLPKVITPTGTRRVSKIVSAERGKTVTLMCAMSAAGVFVPPFLIFPRKRMRPEFSDGCPPGTKVAVCEKGWMTSALFFEYLQHFTKFAKPSRDNPIVLFMDNHSTHLTIEVVNYARDNNLTLIGFPPHCSHRLQPLDVSFYGPLKIFYSQTCDMFMINNPGAVIAERDMGKLFCEACLRAATVKNAVNGFRATGIEPFNPYIFPDAEFVTAAMTDQPEPKSPSRPTKDEPGPSHSVVGFNTQSPATGNVAIVEPASTSDCSSNGLPPLPTTIVQRKRKRTQPPSYHISGTPVKNYLQQKAEEIKKKEVAAEDRLMKKKERNQKIVENKVVRKLFTIAESDSDSDANSILSLKSSSGGSDFGHSGDESFTLPPVAREVGRFVAVTYDVNVFPGVLMEVLQDGARVKTMKRNGLLWKWPEKEDVLFYLWEDIIGGLDPPSKFSTRRDIYSVPALEKYLNNF